MVTRPPSEPPVLDADLEPADGTDLSVEPVERVAGADASGARGGARDRLRHIHLQLQVVALEAALARARRRRALVVEQYERALEQQETEESSEFSWRD